MNIKRKEWDPYWTPTIYAIIHNPTGKMYIGRTEKMCHRVLMHLTQLKNGKHPVEKMQEDCDKYGFDYSVAVLMDGRTEKVDRLSERFFQLLYQTRDPEHGYNYKEQPWELTKSRISAYKVPDDYLDYFLDPRSFSGRHKTSKKKLSKED